ncbi:MAG: hypothetical protein CVU05_13945 [Bacteroidetes bacterium HGW-Bacteroidetes-21]|jgi:hypothetical protein|nr:MAG: hypothetical protein CVU05_13945 [Bacteroidetes bacterium HGW-Bacteroidetes-21]
MNVERLHRILIDLDKDLKTSKLIQLISQVQTHLQNQVNQPNQPAHQTNLVTGLENLYKALEKSAYNHYSPGYLGIIDEISDDIDFGLNLKNKIEGILSSNAITPAKALKDIQDIHNKTNNFQTAITNTLASFKTLNIEHEELNNGECEFGYTIPREYVKNKLSSFKDEVAELSFILNHVSEAVNGEKEEFKVKTISSSDFLLYIVISLQVANVLSKATERILNHYKQVLEIKNLRNQLKEKGVPASKTKDIETHANGMMEAEIKKIAKEVIEEYYNGENGRKNELENGLVISLNKLANRIDKGFNVEIRVKPLSAPKENEEEPEGYQEKVELVKEIQKSARNIEFIDTKGESILGLKEKN